MQIHQCDRLLYHTIYQVWSIRIVTAHPTRQFISIVIYRICNIIYTWFAFYCACFRITGWGNFCDKMATISPDDISRCIFVNEKFCILVTISLRFVPEGPIANSPELVQIMAWRRIADQPLSEPMLIRFTDAQVRDDLNAVHTPLSFVSKHTGMK